MERHFLVDSDIHFTENGIREGKEDNVAKIKSIEAELLLVVGDLTSSAKDGSKKWCGLKKTPDHITPLFKQYVEPIETTKEVYLCMGNHDTYGPQTILNKLKARHGDLKYTFDAIGLHFICCGLYPDDTTWLKDNLSTQVPNVIFFHYPFFSKFASWWSDAKKNEFEAAIKGKRILCICTGHVHSTYIRDWRGFLVVSGAGKKLIKCTVRADNSIRAEMI